MKKTYQLMITVIFASAVALTCLAQSKEATAKSVTGNWKLTVESDNGTTNPSVTLKQNGEELTGTYHGRFGDSPLKRHCSKAARSNLPSEWTFRGRK